MAEHPENSDGDLLRICSSRTFGVRRLGVDVTKAVHPGMEGGLRAEAARQREVAAVRIDTRRLARSAHAHPWC